MPIQSPAKDLRKTSERPSRGLCSGRGAKWAQHSPPKDLRRGSVRTGARKGLRTAHRKTSKSPSKVGAPSLILLRGIPKHLGKKQGEHPYNGYSPCSGNGRTCRDGPVVTDEHRTNCNTRSPRRFRSARCRGLPCGNQSELAGSRRWVLSDSHSPCRLKPVPCHEPWQR